MKVSVNRTRFRRVVNELVSREAEKQFPFDSPRAVVPQTLIPKEMREGGQDGKRRVALFYFFACLYMRGGIQSSTAFKLLIGLWEDYPYLFEPKLVPLVDTEVIYGALRDRIGWAAKDITRFWRENSKRLQDNWEGDPFELIRAIGSYDDAVKWISHHTNVRPSSFDPKEAGFYGFQHKMVSMLLYFYDWEGWFEPRFLYPSPTDFHHYRLLLATQAITIEISNGGEIRYSEQISEKIRHECLLYLKSTGVDPIKFSDAMWLFSLLMCGESPVTVTKEEKLLFLFGTETLPQNSAEVAAERVVRSSAYMRTCARCPLQKKCKFAIPANPYYKRGVIELRKRPRLPWEIERLALVPTTRTELDSTQGKLL